MAQDKSAQKGDDKMPGSTGRERATMEASPNGLTPARNTYADLQGVVVSITNVQGAFRSCVSCGHQTASVDLTPIGLHAGRLICEGCGAQTSYLSREHLAAMLAQHCMGVSIIPGDDRRTG